MTGSSPEQGDDLHKIKQILGALPVPPKKVSKRQQVARFVPLITDARNKGHSLRAIADCLKKSGLDISYSTLVNALPRKHRKARPSNRAKPAAPKTLPAVKKPDPLSSAGPNKAPPKPVVPAKPFFPPGATFIPIGNGEFLPAPDTEDL